MAAGAGAGPEFGLAAGAAGDGAAGCWLAVTGDWPLGALPVDVIHHQTPPITTTATTTQRITLTVFDIN